MTDKFSDIAIGAGLIRSSRPATREFCEQGQLWQVSESNDSSEPTWKDDPDLTCSWGKEHPNPDEEASWKRIFQADMISEMKGPDIQLAPTGEVHFPVSGDLGVSGYLVEYHKKVRQRARVNGI